MTCKERSLVKTRKPKTQKGQFDIVRSVATKTILLPSVMNLNTDMNYCVEQYVKAKISCLLKWKKKGYNLNLRGVE